MAKRDDHIIPARSLAAQCRTCERLIHGGAHQVDDEATPPWEDPPFYCPRCCPLCREREAAR